MCLQIPWTNLGKSAVVVYVDRLYILAGPKTEAASAEDGAYEVSTITAASAMPIYHFKPSPRHILLKLHQRLIWSACRLKLWKERPSGAELTVQSWPPCGCVHLISQQNVIPTQLHKFSDHIAAALGSVTFLCIHGRLSSVPTDSQAQCHIHRAQSEEE